MVFYNMPGYFLSDETINRLVQEIVQSNREIFRTKPLDVRALEKAIKEEPSAAQSGIRHVISNFGVDIISQLDGNMPEEFMYYNDIIKTFTLPEITKYISKRAFQFCDNLESIVIPENVETIDEESFSECIKLRKVLFAGKSKCDLLGSEAFYHCDSLRAIALPDSLIEMDSKCFAFCSKLHTLILPANITYIGERAFQECDSLSILTYNGKRESFLESVTKANRWAENSSIEKIRCIDGDIIWQ